MGLINMPILEEWSALCDQGCDDDHPVCICFEDVLGKRPNIVEENRCPQALLWNWMKDMMSYVGCPAARALMASVIDGASKDINVNHETWGNPDVMKWRSLVHVNGNGKRTRTDPHAKQFVIDDGIKKRRYKTPMEACRTAGLADMHTGRRWADEALAIHRAGAHLECPFPCIMSVTLDGATIGRPAKDMCLILLRLWPRCYTIVAAPQEFTKTLKSIDRLAMFE